MFNVSMKNIFVFIPLLFLPFFPFFAFFYSIIALSILSNYNIDNKIWYVNFFATVGFFTLLITSTSEPLFIYKENDFNVYYDNYLKFLNNGFSFDYFEFAYGEISLPILHYLLSIIVGQPMPYLILFIHSFCISILIYLVLIKMSIYYKLTVSQFSLLIALTLIFYKYGTALNHIRQAYSSLFMLLFLFSSRKSYHYLIISISFHIAAIIIYPIIKFLIFSENKNNLKLFIFFNILFGFIIFFNLTNITSYIISSDSIIVEKLKWSLSNSLNPEIVFEYFKSNFISGIYLIFIILLTIIICFFMKIKSNFIYNLVAILIFLYSFSFIPSLSFRIMSSIFTFLLGFILFKSLVLELNVKRVYLISIILITFFSLRWFLLGEFYFRFPIISNIPFY